MAIRTHTDTETAEARSRQLARSGVATSMAAGAAELLREDPSRHLNPRFESALKAVKARFQEMLDTWDDDVVMDVFGPTGHWMEGERLVAELASVDDDSTNSERLEELHKFLSELVENIEQLLETPNSEVASYVESRLGALSQAEQRAIYAVESDLVESEFEVSAFLSR